MTAPAEQQPISPLVADLMQASLKQTEQITNTVIDSLTEDNAKLRAELTAVRKGITALTSGPWMPTPDAIHNALYPSRNRVEYVQAELGDWPTPDQLADAERILADYNEATGSNLKLARPGGGA